MQDQNEALSITLPIIFHRHEMMACGNMWANESEHTKKNQIKCNALGHIDNALGVTLTDARLSLSLAISTDSTISGGWGVGVKNAFGVCTCSS